MKILDSTYNTRTVHALHAALQALANGWQSTDEVSKKTGLGVAEIEAMLGDLAASGFVTVSRDPIGAQWRLSERWAEELDDLVTVATRRAKPIYRH